MINKRWVSLLTAVSMCIPMVTALQTVLPTAPTAEAAAVSSPAPDHEVRVVAKRITGDDTYLEISLEVDRDYEEYTAVGVVLEYDATKIVPAASWDDGAVEADMSANTSWATRRALPTLGKDTWTSHTALAYQTQKVDTTDPSGTAMIPDKGYLYLGAEYPGTIPDPYDPTVTPDPSASPSPTPSPTAVPTPTDTPDPAATPDPDIYVNPIVVARFMYVGADETAKKATKTAIEGVWTTPAPVPDGTSWDEDWLGLNGMSLPNNSAGTAQNEILHIADDAISARSTAEYGAAIYFSDYSRKVFRYEFPTPVPTSTPTPTPAAGATAAPQPFSTYAPAAVGSAVTTAEQMDAGEIEIVLGEGKSAKSGGLSLSDIYVILFFDWDDSLLGTMTAGVGVDPTEDVHNYVKEKFIHPELRNLDYMSMTDAEKKERKNNYRGEYPENGPSSADPLAKSGAYGDTAAEPGSKYPLTNKLDYAFAGKNLLDTDHPHTFAYGWTQVVPTAPDYSDTTKYPGLLPQVLPKAMKDTFTARDPRVVSQPYGWCPDLDATGNLVNPTDTVPTWIACDFSKITQEDLKASDGNLYVKAVYTDCEWLGRNNSNALDNNYRTVGPESVKTVGSVSASLSTYEISFAYERINELGHGVGRIQTPLINMALTQIGASASTPLKVIVENNETIDVALTPTNAVSTVGYQLWDKDIISGAQRSKANGISNAPFKLTGTSGIMFKFNLKNLMDEADPYVQNVITTGVAHTAVASTYNTQWTDAATWSGLKIYKKETATALTAISGAANIRMAQAAIVELMVQQINLGLSVNDLTWYQMQYAVVKKTAKTTNVPYVSSADAETYLRANNPKIMAEFDSY